MGEFTLNGLECNISILDETTGEYKDLGTIERCTYKIETEIPKKYDNLKFPMSYEGTFKLKNSKKFAYEVFGIKNSYYKHLKRVKNRNKLYKQKTT